MRRAPALASLVALMISALMLRPGAAAGEEEGIWAEGEWSGQVALEFRGFVDAPLQAGQKSGYLSLSIKPEWRGRWDNGDQSVTFIPFVRLDEADSQRTHGDIRELSWLMTASDWEVKIGVGTLFWGVAESRHLVDIINQTDLVESVDGEDKLGQPMINWTGLQDWGTVELYLLPLFRERTFPGQRGRPRTAARIDENQARFESGSGHVNPDWAARWSTFVGDWDLGISHFSGVSREPSFLGGTDDNGDTVLVPYYEHIDQTGLAVQATLDAWLWKLEAISRSGQGDRFSSAVAGFEYTFVGVTEEGADLGWIMEYLVDDRGRGAPHPFQNDLMVGGRLTMNDVQSTDLLAGTIVDLESGAMAFTMEGSRRLGDAWKLTLEGRAQAEIPPSDPLYGYRRDHYLQLELARYF